VGRYVSPVWADTNTVAGGTDTRVTDGGGLHTHYGFSWSTDLTAQAYGTDKGIVSGLISRLNPTYNSCAAFYWDTSKNFYASAPTICLF